MNTTELYNIRLDTGTTRDSTIMEKRGGGAGGDLWTHRTNGFYKKIFLF